MKGKKIIKSSELVLQPDGRIYHLDLFPDEIADDIILVGDPGRVDLIARHFSNIEVNRQNREIHTITGYYKGKRCTVLSTGMGTDNLDIVINELDALANIDLQNRHAKDAHRSLNLIRLGTSGALQADIPLNAFIASEYAIGLDGLLYFYAAHKEFINREMTQEFIRYFNYSADLPRPYAVQSSVSLLEKFQDGFVHGITLTAPGFYGPQGRELRLEVTHPEFYNNIPKFDFQQHRIANFEMETSALYGLGKMLGHKTLTVCVAIANRFKKEFNDSYHDAVEKLIIEVLERI
jgi:uridine phosphorylase